MVHCVLLLSFQRKWWNQKEVIKCNWDSFVSLYTQSLIVILSLYVIRRFIVGAFNALRRCRGQTNQTYEVYVAYLHSCGPYGMVIFYSKHSCAKLTVTYAEVFSFQGEDFGRP